MNNHVDQEPISYDIVHKWTKLEIQANNIKPPSCYMFQRGCVFLDHLIAVDWQTVYTFHLKELYWSKFDLPKEKESPYFTNNIYLVKPGLIVSFDLSSSSGPPYRHPNIKSTNIHFLTFDVEEGVPKNFSVETKGFERSQLPESLGHQIIIPYENALYLFDTDERCSVHLDVFTHINLETGEIIKKKIEGGHPCQRDYCQTVLNNGKLYLFGGQDSLLKGFFDLWVFHLSEMRWEKLDELTSQKHVQSRDNLMCMSNNEIFLCGRGVSDPCTFFSYNLNYNTWSEVYFPKDAPKFFYFISADHDLITLLSKDSEAYSLKNPRKATESRKQEIKAHIAELCQGKTDPDVIFKVEGQEFPANKCFLAYRCPYFKKAFSSNMMESHSNVITINDVKARSFQVLLKYIYMEDFEIESEIAEDLFKLCDEYSIWQLKKSCEEVLIKNLKVENVVNDLMFAEKYDAQELHKVCVDLFAQNLKKVLRTQNFRELETETLILILDINKKKKYK